MRQRIIAGMASFMLAALFSGCGEASPDTVGTGEAGFPPDVSVGEQLGISTKGGAAMADREQAGSNINISQEAMIPSEIMIPEGIMEIYTVDTRITDVVSDAVFGDYRRLIFPVDEGYYGGNTLGSLSLTWYNNIDPDKTVEICNYMKDHALAGDTIFYDIYTEEEKAADPAKRDTGLFFFKGNPGGNLPSAMPGAGLPMWGLCMTASPMRWNCQRWVITLLP